MNQAGSEFIRDQRHVGLSVGIVKDGTRYTYNFGTVDRSVHRLPSDRTIYEIASATKTYTGILLAQAVIDRKVRLDDDVHKYLTEHYPNLSFEGEPIRIVDLANHTSGLPKHILAFPRGVSAADVVAMYGDYTQERFLRDLRQIQIALATAPLAVNNGRPLLEAEDSVAGRAEGRIERG